MQLLVLSAINQCSHVAVSALCLLLSFEDTHCCLHHHHNDIALRVLTIHNSKSVRVMNRDHSAAPLPCPVMNLILTEHPVYSPLPLKCLPQHKVNAGAGRTGGPTAPNLDALWAKLQQQHSLEAEAARLTRRAHSGTVPTGSNSTADSIHKAAEQQALSKEADSRTSGQVETVTGGPVSSLLTPETKQQLQQEQMSEADFWKMMQN